MNPWRSPLGVRSLRVLPRLQWGHGVEPVEIWRNCFQSRSITSRLQWGHGVEPVEISASAGFIPVIVCFNGATGLNPWR